MKTRKEKEENEQKVIKFKDMEIIVQRCNTYGSLIKRSKALKPRASTKYEMLNSKDKPIVSSIRLSLTKMIDVQAL